MWSQRLSLQPRRGKRLCPDISSFNRALLEDPPAGVWLILAIVKCFLQFAILTSYSLRLNEVGGFP